MAFSKTATTFTTIDDPSATCCTSANGINDAGQIVGHGDDGFLKDGATFTTIVVPGGTNTSANGINDAGQIVGFFDNATGGHGFLKDGATFTTIDFPGTTNGSQALGINNAGQIVGSYSAMGLQHGFVATPVPETVPEPASWLPFGLGLVGLVWWRRRTATTRTSA